MRGTTLGPLRSCKLCHEVKTLADFVSNASCANGKAHRCVDCDNSDRQNKHLVAKYGITLAQKNQMAEDQDNTCPICLQEFTEFFNIVVDHDHSTNQVRQLLCRMCNAALGGFGDDPDTLMRAASYILRHKEG